MGDLLFSIITPNFNSGEKLIRTVNSIDTQSVEFEYLVIDGRSNDGSLELGTELAASRSRMRVISAPDRGVYDAMNTGLSLAKGRYMLFMGAGDELCADALSQVSSYLPAHNFGMIYGDVSWSGRIYDGVFTNLKLCRANICHQAIFYGRDVFDKLGRYDLQYKAYADWEFNLRCFGDRRIPTCYIPVTVSIFEAGGLSMSGDQAFERQKRDLIRNHLGYTTFFRYEWPSIKGRLKSKVKSLGRFRRS